MNNYNKRIMALLYLIIFLFLIIIIRLIFLQIVMHNFYEEKSLDQRRREIILSPDRGDIFDREGNLLAVSIDTYSIFVRPKAMKDKRGIYSKLCGLYTDKKSLISDKFSKNEPFWLARKIPKDSIKKIIDLKCNAIDILKEKKRIYPKGTLASQLVGVVGLDNQGLSGIELQYDEYLRGKEGRYIAEKDLLGREIATGYFKEMERPTEGMNLYLTICEPIQYIAQRELESAVKKSKSQSGSIIVMDVKTGDILAIAGYPSFDLSNPSQSPIGQWKLYPITNMYEPGSTFKMITAASGIEEGIVDLDSVIPCPDSLSKGGIIIKNSHPVRYFGKSNKILRDVIAESINTGTSYIGIKLGEEKFYKHIKDFGFGEYTDIDYPGEGKGILRSPNTWYKSDIATITFGQTISITPIQLICAIAAIANNGIRIRPRLVNRIESADKEIIRESLIGNGVKVISIKTANRVKELMKGVVLMQHGTGHLAKMLQYTCAAKTGTAQKPVPGGYQKGHYVASIVGFAPFNSPRIAILVVMDDPKTSIWGAVVAAPVFKFVGEFALRYLNVPPDL